MLHCHEAYARGARYRRHCCCEVSAIGDRAAVVRGRIMLQIAHLSVRQRRSARHSPGVSVPSSVFITADWLKMIAAFTAPATLGRQPEAMPA